MGVLGFILILIASGLLYSWFFKPESFKNPKTGKRPHRMSVYFFSGVLILAGLIFMMTPSNEPVTQSDLQNAINKSGITADGKVRATVTPSGAIMIEPTTPTKIEYEPFDIRDAVERADLLDDDQLIAAAKVPVIRRSDETDSKGEPAKYYGFAKKHEGEVGLMISRSYILLNWWKIEDEPSQVDFTKRNFKIAQRLARSMLGLDGAVLVDRVMSNNETRQDIVVDGVKVVSARCVVGVCTLKVERTAQ